MTERNLTSNQAIEEILLDLEYEFREYQIPEDVKDLTDQGYLLSTLSKVIEDRLEKIKANLQTHAGKDLQPLQEKAVKGGVGGSVALTGNLSTVTIRVGKPAERVSSEEVKKSFSREDLLKKGWVKIDTKPSMSTSFSKRASQS